MLQGLFSLCQMQMEVTTSTPHTLMYVFFVCKLSHPMGFALGVMCTRYTVLIIQALIGHHVQSSKYNDFQRMLLFLCLQSMSLCVMSNLVPSCTLHLYVGCYVIEMPSSRGGRY